MFQREANIAGVVRTFLREDTGQDLIEYALLTALVAVGSIALLSQIATTMNSAYAGPGGWNQAAQDAWVPCPPGGCS